MIYWLNINQREIHEKICFTDIRGQYLISAHCQTSNQGQDGKDADQSDTPVTDAWTSDQVAAPDSIQGRLQSQGRHWVRSAGEITPGVYVQDILEGRLNQPVGRGAIGKVVAVSTGDVGVPAATVDFGCGYSTGINLSELSLVRIIRGRSGMPATSVWTSEQVAAPDSVQGKLQSQGKHWVRTTGKITRGAYVQDILEGRLNQPAGRGAIGKVVTVIPEDTSVPAATVDFGRGYLTGINLSELSLVKIVRGKSGMPVTAIWTSDQVAAPDSVQGKLQSHGKHWVRTTGKISRGLYVQDILESRLNQPARKRRHWQSRGRKHPEDVGVPAATVDFGRGYLTGINLSELSLVRIVRE